MGVHLLHGRQLATCTRDFALPDSCCKGLVIDDLQPSHLLKIVPKQRRRTSVGVCSPPTKVLGGLGQRVTHTAFEGTCSQKERQELLWQDFFLDPTQWRDSRRDKKGSCHPDFSHKRSKEGLWLSSKYKPVWVDAGLARLDAQLVRLTPVSKSTSPSDNAAGLSKLLGYEGDLEVGTWSRICDEGELRTVVDAVASLVHRGCYVDTSLLYRVLKRCIAQKDLVLGRRVHALSLTSGYVSNAFLANHILRMYASHGMLEEATQVFSKVAAPNSFMWASIISAHAELGRSAQAIELYRQMRSSDVEPNSHIFVAVLKACAIAEDWASGKVVHADILMSADEPNIFVGNCLVDMYAKCGSLLDARGVFDSLKFKDVVTWNAMIAGYAQRDLGQEAVALYERMEQEGRTAADHFTFTCLVDVYSKCGRLEEARRVFDSLQTRDVVAWTGMIGGYVQHGFYQEALTLHGSMQQDGIIPASSVTFISLLHACGNVAGLEKGKQIHSQIAKAGVEATDISLPNALIEMYGKCGSMVDAHQVFDALPTKVTATWNALMAGYARQGESKLVFDLYQRMRQEGSEPDSFTFSSVLKVCSHLDLLDKGEFFFQAMTTDYGIPPTIEHYTCIIDLLGRAGQMDKAIDMVKTMPFEADGVVWRSVLSACRKWNNLELGRHAFECAVRLDKNDAAAYVLMSNIYAAAQMQDDAEEVQALRLRTSARKEPGQSWWTDISGTVHSFMVADRQHPEWQYINEMLKDFFNRMKDDRQGPSIRSLFQDLIHDEAVAGRCRVAGYERPLELGRFNKLCDKEKLAEVVEALDLAVDQKYFVDTSIFHRVLKKCTDRKDLALGKHVHALSVKSGYQSNAFVANHLIRMYAYHGRLEEAMDVFTKVAAPNTYMWASIIFAHADHGQPMQAIKLYRQMRHFRVTSNNHIFVAVLKACAIAEDLASGKGVHADIQESADTPNMFLGNCLVDMYAKCGSLVDARNVFDNLPSKDVVTWNSMIAGYVRQGLAQEALNLYAEMEQERSIAPDHFTFACLVDAYVKCGRLVDARRVFNNLQTKDVVTWNAMIAGYAKHGLGREALTLYASMQVGGLTPASTVTFVSLLQACASVGALHQGKLLHAQIDQRGLHGDVVVGSSLVDMYAKCGRLCDAERVFAKMSTKNVVTWNALLNGYARHSDGLKVVQCFEAMRQARVEPDDATFICLLVACSQTGLVNEGQRYFRMMVEDHGIVPTVYHYTCLVDLLGQSGRLEEAENLLQTVSPRDNVAGWTSLLIACKGPGDFERAKRCFDQMVALEPRNGTAYVLLATIYAIAGRWTDVQNIESLRKHAGASKKPARACIEVTNTVHEFTVGEDREDISSKLRRVNRRLKLEGGHVPQTNLVLKAVSEREKEDSLCGHAEKLALAYGLLNTAHGTPLLVTKNLRMCNDCHSSTKSMSRLENRQITVRDTHSVHHFVEGSCSCEARPFCFA